MVKLRICSDKNHPPFDFYNRKGLPDGFNNDVTRAIAKEMNIDIEINLLNWKDAITDFENGEYDAMQGVSITEERKEKLVFCDEYITAIHSVFIRKDREDIKCNIDLNNVNIAVQEFDAGYNILIKSVKEENRKNIKIMSSQEEVLKSLIRKDVDIAIGNKLTLNYAAKKLGFEDLILAIGSPLNITKYSLAFKRNNSDLVDKFNNGMRIIKEKGIYEDIYDKWFKSKIDYFSRQIIETVNVGVICIDSLGRVTAINRFAENDLSLNINDTLFKSYYETKLSTIFNVNIIQSILDGKEFANNSKVKIDEEGNEKYLDIHYTKLVNHKYEEIGVIINFTDITEKKRLEETLARKNRMEALGVLLLNVAHEVRNPLTSIKNFIELLPDNINDMEFREALLYHVPNQVKYINKLLSDLLEYSKPKNADVRAVKVKELLEIEILESIYKTIKDEKKFNVDIILSNDFELSVDPHHLKQILINLIINSIEAIDIQGNIKIDAYEDGNMKVLTIEDDGEKIPKSILSKIFDPFFTTKSKGTGLGLFICYQLMKENNGLIEILNTDKGVKVSLIFSKN